jgi:hypothetical protein
MNNMEYANWFLTENGWISGKVIIYNGNTKGENPNDYVAHFLHKEPDMAFFENYKENEIIDIRDEKLYNILIKEFGNCPNYIP